MSVVRDLEKPFFVLAPMYDVTDTVFRQVIAECAPPDLFFTEFVNVDGLQSSGRRHVEDYLRLSEAEKPIIAQVWGLNPENYYKSAKEISKLGYSGIDINMGCPDKTVVKNGACSALINDRQLAKEIIKSTRKGLARGMSLSVKTRLGFNDIDYSWHEFLLSQNLDMLTIHGRTRAQMSKVPADWEAINKIREIRDKISPETLIVGNGDVNSRDQGLTLAKKYQLDGIMIGRGIFADPFIFSKNSKWLEFNQEERIKLFKNHILLFQENWEDKKPVHILNKFCKIYINNFNGAKEMRETLMSAKNVEQLLSLISSISI